MQYYKKGLIFRKLASEHMLIKPANRQLREDMSYVIPKPTDINLENFCLRDDIQDIYA